MKALSFKEIVSLLETWDADQVVDLFNTYCEIDNCMEDYIYCNTDENLEMCLPSNPVDAFRDGLTAQGSYYSSDDYFIINGYGHLESFSDPVEKSWIIDDLARWLEDNNHQAEWLELDDEEESEEE